MRKYWHNELHGSLMPALLRFLMKWKKKQSIMNPGDIIILYSRKGESGGRDWLILGGRSSDKNQIIIKNIY